MTQPSERARKTANQIRDNVEIYRPRGSADSFVEAAIPYIQRALDEALGDASNASAWDSANASGGMERPRTEGDAPNR
jgi:hypothetical protein